MALTEAQVVILYSFLLCRLLVVGPVLKWLALCMYVCIYVILRRQCPDHTFRYFWLKFRM